MSERKGLSATPLAVLLICRRPWASCFTAGLLLWLSWPPFSFFPLQVVAFIPLILLADFPGISVRKYFLLSSLFAAVWACGTLYWIALASLPAALGAILIHVLLTSGVFALWFKVNQAFVSKKYCSQSPATLNRCLSGVFLTSAMILLETGKTELVNFPWLNLGRSMAGHPGLIQYYELGGCESGSVFILVASLLACAVLQSQTREGKFNRAICGLLGIWMTIPLASFCRMHAYSETVRPVLLRLVQPGTAFFKPRGERQPHLLDALLRLSAEKANPGTDYFIWPESSLEPWHSLDENSLDGQECVARIRRFLRSFQHAAVLCGALTYRTGPGRDTSWFNTALFLESGKAVWLYHKQRLVPGAEGAVFQFQNKGSGRILLPGAARRFLRAGSRQPDFSPSSGLALAPIICFESAFSTETAEKVASGALLLTQISNDAWWQNSPGRYQSLVYAAIPAIENRRWMLRASLGGISACINSKGETVSSLNYAHSGYCDVVANASAEPSFYTWHKNLVFWIALATLLLGLLYVAGLIFAYDWHSATHAKRLG